MPLRFTRALADTLYLFQSTSTSMLSSNYTLSAGDGVYEDLGLSISLPSAGVYRLFFTGRGVMNVASGTSGFIEVKLRDETASADVPNSNLLLFLTSITGQTFQFSGAVSITYTVSQASTIKMYAQRTGTFTTSIIASNADGQTTLSYQKISN